MFAESIKEVLFPIEKQNLYVRNNLSSLSEHHVGKNMYILMDSLTFVGECLVNMEDSTIYKIGKQLKYTSTKELIELVLTEYGKFTTHIIFYNKDKSSTYINLILQNHRPHEMNYRYALEISNNYSGRFNSKVILSLYNVEKDIMIRTPIPAFTKGNIINQEGLAELHDILRPKSGVFIDYNILKKFPKRYRRSWNITGGAILSDALNLLAEVTNKWLITNYELATSTQKEIYTILSKKGVKE